MYFKRDEPISLVQHFLEDVALPLDGLFTKKVEKARVALVGPLIDIKLDAAFSQEKIKSKGTLAEYLFTSVVVGHGLSFAVLNAVCSTFDVFIFDKTRLFLSFQKGALVNTKEMPGDAGLISTIIQGCLDPDIVTAEFPIMGAESQLSVPGLDISVRL